MLSTAVDGLDGTGITQEVDIENNLSFECLEKDGGRPRKLQALLFEYICSEQLCD